MKKLIRDNLVEPITKEGRGDSISYEHDKDVLKVYVAEKIVEESKEILEAVKNGDSDNILEEIADLFTIIPKLMDLEDLNEGDIVIEIASKMNKRGGFYNNVILEIDDETSQV